jgi:hypothetical protein
MPEIHSPKKKTMTRRLNVSDEHMVGPKLPDFLDTAFQVYGGFADI